MSTVLLVRHGLTPLTGPVLPAGRPGVHLDDRGPRAKRRVSRQRIAALPIAAVVTSPLERCVETADLIRCRAENGTATARRRGADRVRLRRPDRQVAQGPGSGSAVESSCSPAVQPCGFRTVESLARGRGPSRPVESVTGDARLGADAVWVACSHGD